MSIKITPKRQTTSYMEHERKCYTLVLEEWEEIENEGKENEVIRYHSNEISKTEIGDKLSEKELYEKIALLESRLNTLESK